MTKFREWLVAALMVAGVLLLCKPSPAQVSAAAPTRFTVVDEGTAGKPDVVLVPGLTSSREGGRRKQSFWSRITGCTWSS